MKRLSINFATQPVRQPWWDWLVLLLGLLVTMAVIFLHQHLDDEVGELAYKKERLQHALSRAEPDEPLPKTIAEQTPAGAAWLEMLDALGLELGESVTLLSLQGEKTSDQLDIQFEAKDTDAMFSFIARLEANAHFSEVALRSHETVRDHPHKPVRFAVTLTWRRGV